MIPSLNNSSWWMQFPTRCQSQKDRTEISPVTPISCEKVQSIKRKHSKFVHVILKLAVWLDCRRTEQRTPANFTRLGTSFICRQNFQRSWPIAPRQEPLTGKFQNVWGRKFPFESTPRHSRISWVDLVCLIPSVISALKKKKKIYNPKSKRSWTSRTKVFDAVSVLACESFRWIACAIILFSFSARHSSLCSAWAAWGSTAKKMCSKIGQASCEEAKLIKGGDHETSD